jgi:hypothetical protein
MDPIMANESQPLWVKPPSLEVNLVGREPSKNWDFHGLGMKVYGQVATLRAWISSSAYKKSRDHLKVSHTISSPTAPRIGDPDEHHISPQSSCHFFFSEASTDMQMNLMWSGCCGVLEKSSEAYFGEGAVATMNSKCRWCRPHNKWQTQPFWRPFFVFCNSYPKFSDMRHFGAFNMHSETAVPLVEFLAL